MQRVHGIFMGARPNQKECHDLVDAGGRDSQLPAFKNSKLPRRKIEHTISNRIVRQVLDFYLPRSP
jgi:hypothetical protein